MDPRQMAYRCPDASLLKIGALYGYRFVINTRGYATIVPDREFLVLGVIWEICPECEKALDLYEGVDIGMYSRASCRVELLDGSRESADCLVYVDPERETGRPREGYMEAIMEVAAALKFPEAYLAELAACALE